MLSSVYWKPADQFVKKIRDRINEKLDDEEEEGPKGKVEDVVDSSGVMRSDYA